MLTTHLLSYYNHLLATTVLYFTIVDPLKEITNSLNQHLEMDQYQDPNHHYHHNPSSLAFASEDSTRDYYQILGVSKDATKHEIHKAFRQMAKKYHPDKNKEKGAQDEFIKIFKAYETLSDEKKRKEYDDRAKAPNQNSFNGWHPTNQMHDFDMNDFFKQYEDQFSRHARHYTADHHHYNQQNHHNHQHFSFHGVNLDDLFHDIDEDEFQSFGRMFDFAGHNDLHAHPDGSFGDGASFFGTHLESQIHDTLHHYQHQQNIQSGGNRASYSCQTITKQVNGMMMTQTSCM